MELAPSPNVADPEPRVARGPGEHTPESFAQPSPPKNIETLESLEEEMAKLLGRPTQRRDG